MMSRHFTLRICGLVAGVAIGAAAVPALAQTTLIGSSTITSSTDQNAAGQAEAFTAVAAATGSVSTISVYIAAGSAANRIVVGLYAGTATAPTTLLGQGSLSAPVAGQWNTVPLTTPAAVTSGTSYWIALLSPAAAGAVVFRDKSGGTRSVTSSSKSLTTLPTAWTSGTAYTDSPLAAYGATAASPNPILSVAPTTIAFSALAGGSNPPPAALQVTNAGSGSLSFTASSDSSWLAVSPASGTAPASLQVAATSTGLVVGSYAGNVTVTSSGVQGSPKTIAVNLSVNSAAGTSADWLTGFHDPERSNNASAETTITTATAKNLAPLWATTLDGKITSQPLYAGSLTVAGGTHNVVFAATDANSLFAVDADLGSVLWQRNFGAQANNISIPGGFGIIGPPVIDRANGRLFLVSDDGLLHTVALATGTDLAAALSVIAQPLTNKVWGALNKLGNNLYIATGSDCCDTQPWSGQVIRVDVSGAAPVLGNLVYAVTGLTGNDRGGGIWGYGGVSIDSATGQVLAASGSDVNSGYTPNANRVIAYDSTLNVLGTFVPSHPTSYLCQSAPCDVDFGATPTVFQPSGCPTMAAVGNKNGFLYVLRTADLAASLPAQQAIQLNVASDSLGNGGIGGNPAYWSGGRMLFVGDTGPGFGGVAAGVVGLTIGAAPACTVAPAWSVTLGGANSPNSVPLVANGVVFIGEGDNGRVHAYDGASGAELWNSGSTVGVATFASPMVAAGKLFVGSWDGFASSSAGTLRAFAPSVATGCSSGVPSVQLLGDSTIGANDDSNSLGAPEAFQVTATNCGNIGSISLYVAPNSTAGTIVVGLYTDSAGHPGALLAQGSVSAAALGAWNTITIPKVAVTTNTPYWIAVLGTQSGTVHFRDRQGGCSSEASAVNGLTALPATWTSGTRYPDCPLSAYGSSVP